MSSARARISQVTGDYFFEIINMVVVPDSDHTVRVRLLDTTTYLTGIAKVFVDPVVAGHEIFSFNDFAFLIENQRLGKKVMFDLGTRKDYWNLAPSVQQIFGTDSVMTGMRIDKNVSEILTDGGIELSEIGKCRMIYSTV